ncbi:MAG: LCP family protein [Bacillota bacterium]|nr:LCP family protein [Bacillota bacterium]
MARIGGGDIGLEPGGPAGPIGPSPFEPVERPRLITFWRMLFLVGAAIAALVITLYVLVSSWLAPEATFGVGDRPVNILILGTDRTYDDHGKPMEGPVRADVIMLASVNPQVNKIYLVSIPRDTRARIPGHGTNKVNASHTFGGQDLTRRTVEDLVGVPIDRYVEADFQGFVRIVDALGGVEIDVDKDMRYVDRAGGFKVDLKKGRQVLDGAKALGYVRYRADALGDISRVRRQQTLLKAVARQAVSLRNLRNARKILGILMDHVRTDMSRRDMASIGWFVVRTKAEVVSETLPGEFSPLYWVPDQKRIDELVDTMLEGFGK